MDNRYLGFFLPQTYEDSRIVDLWKTRKDLKWFGVELHGFGWNILRMIDDVVAIGWALDLAFGFRRFGPEGILGERTLLHKKAYESLKRRADAPPYQIMTAIKLWKFFSEFEPAESDVVTLMKECGVTLDEVQAQVKAFYEKGLTTPYRDSQYPPYLVVDKMKKRYKEEVRNLLGPMEVWLSDREPVTMIVAEVSARDVLTNGVTVEGPLEGQLGAPSRSG